MDNQVVSEFIKKIRKDNKLTQKEFANRIGVTFQAVSKWENGKNIPDISTLKIISREFNVSISEILDGNKKKKEDKKLLIFCVSLFLFIVVGGTICILLFRDNDISLKKVSTTCDNFDVNGSIAYNNDKMSILISDISYCGKENSIVYKEIGCNLYSKSNDNVIASCERKENVTLGDYVHDIDLNMISKDNICSNNKDDMYLQIIAHDSDDVITSYLVPLVMEDNCGK